MLLSAYIRSYRCGAHTHAYARADSARLNVAFFIRCVNTRDNSRNVEEIILFVSVTRDILRRESNEI